MNLKTRDLNSDHPLRKQYNFTKNSFRILYLKENHNILIFCYEIEQWLQNNNFQIDTSKTQLIKFNNIMKKRKFYNQCNT